MAAESKVSSWQGLASSGFDMILQTLVAIKIKKDQDKLIAEITNLTEDQRIQLEKTLLQSKSDSERLSIILKTIAVNKNSESLADYKRKRNSKIFITVGLLGILTVIIIKAKK